MTATETALPRICDFPQEVTQDQCKFVQREGFIQFGRLLEDSDLIPLRFAYERVWEANPIEEEARANAAPGHRALSMEHFLDEPDIIRLIANEYFLRIVCAALARPPEEIEYAGGYIHRQRCQKAWDYEEFGWNGWHQDAQPSQAPLCHLNIWIYLDDCSKLDGVTQVLIGSCEQQRENLRKKRHPNDGINEMWGEQDSLDTGFFAEGPAGGGFAWGGFLWHRITPNRTGRPRRLVTWEYRHKSVCESEGSLYREKTTPEQRSLIAESLPEDKRFLVAV
ncbi:MAG: phytanoyl-CoA dioxygenase family protein [Planctomycetota bacterium]|nr:phytanoyl-CoA dioxygenase family protein [Planctomycetota bacterium]